MKQPKYVALNIERRRQELKMSQKELAEKVGLTPATIVKYEQAGGYPLPENLEKLANALQCSVADLEKETTAQSLHELRKAKGVKQKDAAEALKVSRATYIVWEQTDKIPAPRIPAIAAYFDVDESVIENFVKTKNKSDPSTTYQARVAYRRARNQIIQEELTNIQHYDDLMDSVTMVKKLPNYYQVCAGDGTDYDNLSIPIEDIMEVPIFDTSLKIGHKKENLYMVLVDGDSMSPLISDGDQVIFDHSDTSPIHGNVYVVALNGAIMVKTLLVNQQQGTVILHPLNKNFDDIIPQEFDSFTVLGRVFRKITGTNIGSTI